MTDTTVRLKRSSTSGGVPNISDLSLGELAVNTFDGKLFFKKDNGTASIIEVGSGSGGGSGPSAAVKVLLYEKTNSGNADSFDGSETRFQLRDASGTVISNLSSASQLLISIDGVVQEPHAGSSGTDGFYISNTANGTDIIFLAAPASGSDFFGMVGILSGSFATVATSGDYDDLTNKPNLSLKANLDSSGRLLVGTTTGGTAAADNITLEDSGDCGITIRSGSSSHSSIYFADGTTQPAIYAGFIDYQHNIDMLRLGTNGGQTRMVIDSSGSVSVGSTATSGTGVHLRPFGNVISRRASGSLQVFEGYQGSTLTSEILANGNARFGGSVGIGCTPVRDLQLHAADASSELMLSNSTTGATAGSGFMIQQDGNDNYIWNKENSFMSFGTNAIERMRIDSTGDLKLQYTGKFILTEGTNNAFSISTNGANGHFLIRDEYNNSDVMIINNSGRVGIGTSNPSHALHVTGDIRAGTTSYNDYGIKAYTNSASYGGIYSQNNNTSGFVFTGNNGSANTVLIKSDGKVETTGNGSFYTVNRTGTLSATAALYLGFVDSSQKFKVGIDGTGTFAGKLGVGTTAPAKDLEIFKDSFPCFMLNDGNQYKSYMQLGGNDLEIRGSSGKLEFYTGAADGLSSDERMCITSVGNVGIGSSSPINYTGYTTLTLDGTSGGVVELLTGGTKKGTIYSTSSLFYIQTRPSVDLVFVTSDIERMRLDSNGNLKLRHTGKFILTEGTTNAFSLSTNGANGNLTVRDEYNNSDRITVNHLGRVGIGLSNPIALLDVLGQGGAIPGTAPKKYLYSTDGGIRTIGTESAVDIVSQDIGNHASSILLRGGNKGYGFVNNHDDDRLDLKSFTANADAFYIHGSTGVNLSAHTSIASFTKAGNVGINEVNPDLKLHIRNDNSPCAKFGGEAGGSYYLEVGQINTNGSPGLNATGTSAALKLLVNGTEQARIIDHGGICFHGDSASQNALDDYEEGTFTPQLQFGGGNTGMSMGNNTGGSYTKIGRMVYVHIRVEIAARGSSTGIASVAGLPFTAGNYQSGGSSVEHSSAIGGYQQNCFITTSPTGTSPSCRIMVGTSVALLSWTNCLTGDHVDMSHSAFDGNASFAFDVVYQV